MPRRKVKPKKPAVKTTKEWFRRLVEHAADAIFVHDTIEGGRILDVNRNACDSLGYSRDELLEMSISDIAVNFGDGSACKNLDPGETITIEDVHRRKDETTFPVEVHIGLLEADEPQLILGIARDITERKRSKDAVNKSEERLQTLLNAIPDIIFFKDAQGRHLLVNKAHEDIFGLNKKDVIGKTVKDILPPDAAEHCKKSDEKVIRNKKPFQSEEHATDKNGNKIILDTIKIPLYDNSGNSSGLVGIARDITERKRVEDALVESEGRFRGAFENTAVGASMVDLKGRFIKVNRRLCEMLGYSEEELLSLTFSDITHPDDIQIGLDNLSKQLSGKADSTSFEKRYLRKDGNVIHVIISPSLIRGSSGEPKCFVGLWQDITKRKTMEDQLRAAKTIAENERAKTEAVIAGLGVGIIIRDLDYKVMYENEVQQNSFGNHVGEYCYKAYMDNERICDDCPMVFSLRDGGIHKVEREFPTEEGTEYYELTTSPLKDSDGNIVGGIKVVKDITDRKESEELIRTSLKEKEVLLQEVHHRVKNNMQIIASMLNLQSKYIKDKKVLQLFRESQSRILAMALIHEKLYMSKDIANINFRHYVGSLARNLLDTLTIKSQNIALELDIDEVSFNTETAIPCGLIINELVSNSINHAFPNDKDGEISIALQREDSGGLALTVKDNGIGIPEGLDIRNSKSLGLELVSLLAEKQLQSTLELNTTEGTEFTIRFKELRYSKRL
jgi:PAS domain S-box-containing protein